MVSIGHNIVALESGQKVAIFSNTVMFSRWIFRRIQYSIAALLDQYSSEIVGDAPVQFTAANHRSR
jgi:hypothetical protein